MYACVYALLFHGYEHDCVHFHLCNRVCDYGDYRCDCAYVRELFLRGYGHACGIRSLQNMHQLSLLIMR